VKTADNGFEVSWDPSAGAERYVVQRACEYLDDNNVYQSEPWADKQSFWSGDATYRDNSVVPDRRYFYRVKALNGLVRSESSNEFLATLVTMTFGAHVYDWSTTYTTTAGSPGGSITLNGQSANTFNYIPNPNPVDESDIGEFRAEGTVIGEPGTSYSFMFNVTNSVNMWADYIDEEVVVYPDDLSLVAVSPYAFLLPKAWWTFLFWEEAEDYPKSWNATKVDPEATGYYVEANVTFSGSSSSPEKAYIPKAEMQIFTSAGLQVPGKAAPKFQTFYIPYTPNLDFDDGLPNGASDSSDEVMGANDDDFLRVVLDVGPRDIVNPYAVLHVPSGMRVFSSSGDLIPLTAGNGDFYIATDFEYTGHPLAGLLNGPVVLFVEGTTHEAKGVLSFYYGGVEESVYLLPMEIIRDDALRTDDDDMHVNLDDWPQSGTNQRSPKYIFATDDNILVKVTGPQGLGDDKLKVKVTSETDTTGITFDLAEISPGVFVNESPAKPLRLGKLTEAKSDCVTIKVVDEEVLTFNLFFDGTDTGRVADVMVDRGEFASAGITVFYGSATGDRSTVRTEAITNTKFFDGGDGNYANNIAATSTALFDFAKNFGANQSDNLEVDFLHISAHGDVDGKIYDDTGAVAIDPASVSGGWNTDAEWAMLATCNQLNVSGGGRAAWEPVLNGSPRKAHAILGAYKPLSGDLRNHVSAFWTDIRQNREVVIDAYSDAMGSGADPQPWAFLVNAGNIDDRLKEVTRDTSGTVSFVYLDVDAICGRAGGSDDERITQVIDSGNGLVRTDLPSVENRMMRKALKLRPSSDFSKSTNISFAKEVISLPDGRHKFVGRKTSKALSERSTLTKEQAAEMAKDYLDRHFREFASRVQLKDVGQKVKGDWLPNGRETSQINGYLVQFSVMSGDAPVWDSYVNVIINGDQVDGLDFRVYQQTNQANSAVSDENAVHPLDVRTGLAKALSRFKKELAITGKYEILKAELCYVNRAVALGQKIDLNENFVPAWHLVVNSEYGGEKSVRRLFHVWMDASTGEFLSKKPY
jgi:hypothetical protein